MSQLSAPLPILNFTSVLYRTDKHTEEEIISLWEKRFGESMIFHHHFFPMKEYYSSEMGEEDLLGRFFLISTTPALREDLIAHKIWADNLEQEFSENKKRTLNLDPGYVSLENVVLSTGKNYSHRVFLGAGVFAELTLIFKQPSFVVTNWTYPDYAHPQVIEFFNWIRNFLLVQVKSGKA